MNKKSQEFTVTIKVLVTDECSDKESKIEAVKKFFRFHNGVVQDVEINGASLMFDDKNIKVK